MDSKMSASYAETNDISSFIGNITLAPTEGISLAVFYNSEPGDNQRNNTLGGSFHFEISRLTLDLEHITALQRERKAVDFREHKESALSGAVAFQFTEQLKAAIRYEVFDDDIPGNQDGHLKDRYSLGAAYNLFKKDSFVTSLMAELRRSNFEKAVGSAVDDSLTEFFAKLAIEF